MNKKFFDYDDETFEKRINNLLNNNSFYFILTILSLLFSYYISLNIGSYIVSFIISFWIFYKNNYTSLLNFICIIIIIFIICVFILYYFKNL